MRFWGNRKRSVGDIGERLSANDHSSFSVSFHPYLRSWISIAGEKQIKRVMKRVHKLYCKCEKDDDSPRTFFFFFFFPDTRNSNFCFSFLFSV